VTREITSTADLIMIVSDVVVVITMNILDLTPQQLKRAAAIRKKIDNLNGELRSLVDGSMTNSATSRKKRRMSAAVRKKIAAAQNARWAKLRRRENQI
jgi:hypothetical protein